MTTGSSEHRRLRYVLDGAEHHFELVPGEYRLGSSPQSDLRLDVAGVSREHALLKVTPETLLVVDRGSKNGTFINRQRVDRGGLPPGAVLTLGPVDLHLEELDPEDVILALRLHDVAPVGQDPNSSGLETLSDLGPVERSSADFGLLCLEGFSRFLPSVEEGILGPALDFLAEALGLSAIAAVEFSGEQTLVLAAVGPVRSMPRRRDIRCRGVAAAEGDLRVLREATSEDFLFRTTLCLMRVDEPHFAMVIWSSDPESPDPVGILRPVLRFLEFAHRRSRLEPNLPTRPPVSSKLVAPDDFFFCSSPPFRELYRQMEKVLEGDLPLLLLGETGVGKEKLVQVLHASFPRSAGPLVAINCAAVPADLLEAELFGIGRGVASGVSARPGQFQRAAGGTLFLDEIGEMPLGLQAKLLRVLQEREIQPLGAPAQSFDARVVAATNSDLYRRMEEGDFRPDLFFRLAGSILEIPPLRDCVEDIVSLTEFFLRRHGERANLRIRGLTAKALRVLCDYPWPGNIRELEFEIRRAVLHLTDGGVLDTRKLSARIRAARKGPGRRFSHEAIASASLDLDLETRMNELEKHLLGEALRQGRGRQVQAAELLGISRYNLARKLKRHGIDYRVFREAASDASGQNSG